MSEFQFPVPDLSQSRPQGPMIPLVMVKVEALKAAVDAAKPDEDVLELAKSYLAWLVSDNLF